MRQNITNLISYSRFTKSSNLYFLRSFALIIIFLTIAFAAYTQGTITGKLLDEKKAPLRFANITLLKAKDSSFVAGGVSNAEGKFSINVSSTGNYFLKFTSIGFSEIKTESFEVPEANFSKDFGNIVLKPDAKTLKDVSITTLRPTITQKADRMIVNVEGTAMAAGSNAFSVLSKSPGVFIDQDGNIQLNGRAGVTVMIDNKLTYLSARDLKTLLEGMSSENVKNIEIITNPSSKYDAQGSSGIVNINLKKNTQQGMNGSVYTSYNYNFKQHGYTAGGNINYKTGKWNSFMTVDYARRVGGREATFTRVFFGPNKTTYFDQTATGNFLVNGPPSIRLGTDYEINSKNSVGFTAYYTTNTGVSDFLTETYIGADRKNPAQYIDAKNFNENTFTNRTANVHYVHKIDTLGSTLSTDFDFVKITNQGKADYFNSFTDLGSNQKTQDNLYAITPGGYDIYSARIDYVKPYNKDQKFEIGAKASRVTSDNDNKFYFANGPLVLDNQRSNHFYYAENIYAGYFNWNGNLSKKVMLQAGLRGEQTESTGESFTTNQVTKRKYFGLFPSLFLQQKVNDKYGINYSYSRRLTRPNYGNLNPFKAFRDPYTWYEGNPYLKPQYTHSFSVAQSFKKLYILTLSYQLNKDVMAEIPILDVANTTTVYTTGNVDDGHSASMTAVGPVKIAKKWDTQNTLLLSYNKFSMMSNNGQLTNDQLFFMFQSNHTILLPKEIRMEMNLLYRGPAASGLYHMAAMHRVDLAFKKSFLKKKFDVSLNAGDIFKGFQYLWTTDINGNVNEFDQYFRFRSVGFSLRYNFSKGQKVDTKKRNAVEELNRTN